jgi:hypothetical protein
MVEIEKLRDLVSDKLQENGCYQDLKAKLRSNVLELILQEEKKLPKNPINHFKLLHNVENDIATQIILEFLQFHNLLYTANVFKPEVDMVY